MHRGTRVLGILGVVVAVGEDADGQLVVKAGARDIVEIRHVPEAGRSTLGTPGVIEVTSVEQVEAMDAVWRSIEAMNVDLKMALLLRDVVGLSYTEIGLIMTIQHLAGAISNLPGGVIVDLGIHDIDYARWVAGDVIRVSASEEKGEGGLKPAGLLEEPHHVLQRERARQDGRRRDEDFRRRLERGEHHPGERRHDPRAIAGADRWRRRHRGGAGAQADVAGGGGHDVLADLLAPDPGVGPVQVERDADEAPFPVIVHR